MEVSYTFYRVLGVRWQSESAATTRDVALVGSVASSRASSDEDEDDDVSFVSIHAKGYLGCVGLSWAGAAGLLVAASGLPQLGCGWAARPGKLLSFILFSVFFLIFCFEFCFSIQI
jgi:hypothetical protein